MWSTKVDYQHIMLVIVVSKREITKDYVCTRVHKFSIHASPIYVYQVSYNLAFEQACCFEYLFIMLSPSNHVTNLAF